MSDFKTYDESGNLVELTETDFNLVQANTKIHDAKFETKTTTFAKDAFRRFCKNKSSVAGAIIIGFLALCSIILPFAIPYDIEATHPEYDLLPPRLVGNQKGFWDGTEEYVNKPYDSVNNRVFDEKIDMNAIVEGTLNISKEGDYFVYQGTKGAYGGSYIFSNNKRNVDASAVTSAENVSTMTSYQSLSSLTADYTLSMVVDFENVTDISQCNFTGDTNLGQYRAFISYLSGTNKTDVLYLSNWMNTYDTVSFDVQAALVSNNITSLNQVRFGLELSAGANGSLSYVAINSIAFESANANVQNVLSSISISDANAAVLMQKDESGAYPLGYWQVKDGGRTVYKANIIYSSFRYDKYLEAFGSIQKKADLATLNKLVEQGYCELTYPTDDKYYDSEGYLITNVDDAGNPLFAFTRYEETAPTDCPYSEIVSIRKIPGAFNFETGLIEFTYEFTLMADNYALLGFDKIPSFIFGTNKDGRDLVKLAFSSLRTSFLLAVVVSAINFTIGLIWGSTSGYFGGNVDLAMERITDILNGVPFTVVVTLCLLHLGNNIVTFGIALCLTGWIGVAARTRTQFYRFKGREYVLASRTLGAKDTRLIFNHILPNALGTLVTSSVLMIPGIIFSESSLAYLGLGLQGTDSFGVLLADNQQYLTSHSALIIFPAIVISLLMISFNLFGNGLRDALNPSLKGSE